MPALKNPRHERFAQLLASGKTAAGAYEEAGYKRDDGNSWRFSKKEEITARVQEITRETFERERAMTAAAAERATITRQGLIEMAEEIRTKAIAAGQLSAAVAATKEIGVLAGIRIERSERGAPGEFDWLEKLSVDELQALADGKLDIASYREGAGSGGSRPHWSTRYGRFSPGALNVPSYCAGEAAASRGACQARGQLAQVRRGRVAFA